MIFLDGVGIGLNDPAFNPFCASKEHLLDHFQDTGRPVPVPFNGIAKGVDATLGVEGLPQSATGQTAIFTGINASRVLGRHLFGFPNKKLQEIIRKHSLFKKIAEKGKKAQFINVYRPVFFELGEKIKETKLSVTTHTNLASGFPFLTIDDLIKGKGISHEFTNQVLQELNFDVPTYSATKAAKILSSVSETYDFTLYEYFQTDKAGHSQDMEWGQKEVLKLEEFLIELLKRIDLNKTLIFVVSDHGNLEDLSTRGHTLNPAIFIAWGQNAAPFADSIRALTDITPSLLKLL